MNWARHDGERIILDHVVLEYWCDHCDLPALKTLCPHCGGNGIGIVITQRTPENELYGEDEA
jgi:predicted RNA-binding protein with PUA domain